MTKTKTVMAEKEEYHRVWNFIVPLSALGNDESVRSIPPLTKKASRKRSKAKTTKA
jgi:hypothetical protein